MPKSKYNTYADLIKDIQKGVYVSAGEFREKAKAFAIYKLEMEQEFRDHVFEVLLELSPEARGGRPIKPGTKLAKRQENFQNLYEGKPVPWSVLDSAKREIIPESNKHHLGHKEISNLRIHGRAIQQYWPESERPADFDQVMRKYQALIQLLDNLETEAIAELGISSGNIDRFYAFVESLEKGHKTHKVDISLTSEQSLISASDYSHTITVEIEDEFENLVKGAIGQQLAKHLQDYLVGSSSAQNRLRNILDKVDIDIHGSPSVLDDLFRILGDLFLHGKLPKIRRRHSMASSKSTPFKPGIKLPKYRPVKEPKGFKRRAEPGIDTGINIVTLLNNVMHGYVRQNMGNPYDPPIQLRYQTGRFAESVEVLNVVKTRSQAINVYYTFMKYPYGTFLPGGRLYTPERDPTTIIDRSIRQAASDLITSRLKFNTELV